MTTYKIDTAHSEIKFKVKHLMITTITGEFTQFDATLETEKADFSDAKIGFEAIVDSISTGQLQRDGHLKSDDFFNAEAFPKLSFTSSEFTYKDDSEYKLAGNLTIRDVTKPVTLDVEFGGAMVDSWGQQKLGFELTGKISRSEFGLKWSAATETGGLVVGDEVKLAIAVQFVKQ